MCTHNFSLADLYNMPRSLSRVKSIFLENHIKRLGKVPYAVAKTKSTSIEGCRIFKL